MTGYQTSRTERYSFALFMTGQVMFNSFTSTYTNVYFTKIGISATAVGTLFLLARVWDAVNDPMFGLIIDRSNLKGGKFLPFLKIAAALVPLTFIMLFTTPEGFSVRTRLIWASAAYLLYGMAYTVCDVPIFSMTSAITNNVQERVGIMSRNSIFAGIATIAVTILAPQMYLHLGWNVTAIMLAVPAALFMLIFVRCGKERYINKDEEKVTIRAMFTYIKENKYLRIYYIALTVMNVTTATNTVAAYFAAYNLGDESKMTLLAAAIGLPAVFAAIVLPLLTRKFDKFKIFITASIINALLGVTGYFIGYQNFNLFITILTARGFAMGMVLVTQLQFTGDIVEYGEYKTGKRLQGIAYSIQTFTFKFFNAIASAVAMYILGAFGFISGENSMQSDTVKSVIWMLLSLSPAVGVVLSMPLFYRYRLRDKAVQIMAKINNGEIDRQEGEKLLAAK